MTREKLEGLWEAKHGETPQHAYRTDSRSDGANFLRLLDLGTDEAFLAAAMMCVPEERAIHGLKECERGHWYVNLRPRDWLTAWRYGTGTTPAKALIEAITLTKESKP